MKIETEYRVTVKIRNAAGHEKTVRLTANRDNLETKLRRYFGAVAYKLRTFGSCNFAASIPWEEIPERTVKNA